MYKYVVLCLCASLIGALCDLNKEEGSACEWDGVKGKCVKETQCFSTLLTRGDQYPVCSKNGDVTIVCCTDCKLVRKLPNVVLSATTGYFYYKDGTKGENSCLEYADTLPYSCRDGQAYHNITKIYDEAKKCHTIDARFIWGAPTPTHEAGAEYPHQALLGFGEDLASVKWQAGGSIISNKYILTAAHVGNTPTNGPLKFVALGVNKISDGPTAWQTHTVKRFVQHPDFKKPQYYNDIALIETENTITFNKNVLPACLHFKTYSIGTAITTTWRDLKSESNDKFADTIQTIHLDEFSEEECKTAYGQHRKLRAGINHEIQMCYGSKSSSSDVCKGISGEPLLIKKQFSRCIYTVIGVTSFGKSCGASHNTPDVYTRVGAYTSWIESVVWA